MRGLGSFFDVAANATFVNATFDDTGLLVPYVPDLVLRADAALFHDLPWRLAHEPIRATVGYGVSYVGKRPLPCLTWYTTRGRPRSRGPPRPRDRSW